MERKIAFDYQNILTINGNIQHIDDTVPDALALFVKEIQHEIVGKMEHLIFEEIQLAPDRLPSRPTILIAKLALLRDIGDVLTFNAIQSSEYIFSHHKYIKQPYSDYWVALSQGPLSPLVQRRGGEESEQGIWLGVTIPK